MAKTPDSALGEGAEMFSADTVQTPVPPLAQDVPAQVDGELTEVNDSRPLPDPPMVFRPSVEGILGESLDVSRAIRQVIGGASTVPVDMTHYQASVKPTLVPGAHAALATVQITVQAVNQEAVPTVQMEVGPNFVRSDPWLDFATEWHHVLARMAPGAFTVMATSRGSTDMRDSLLICVVDYSACVQMFGENDFSLNGLRHFECSRRYAAAMVWEQMAQQILCGTLRLRVSGKFPCDIACGPEHSMLQQVAGQMADVPDQPQQSWRWAWIALAALAISAAVIAVMSSV